MIRESFEKQPVRTVAEACECTLSNQRSGTGIGDAVRNHVVIPAAVFAQSEPDRMTVEVRQTSRSLRSLPADLRSVSSCHPRGSRRSFNHSHRKAEVADDAQVPAIRRCFTHGRVRYKMGLGMIECAGRPLSLGLACCKVGLERNRSAVGKTANSLVSPRRQQLTPLPCGGPARLDPSLERRRSAVLISGLATGPPAGVGGGLGPFLAV